MVSGVQNEELHEYRQYSTTERGSGILNESPTCPRRNTSNMAAWLRLALLIYYLLGNQIIRHHRFSPLPLVTRPRVDSLLLVDNSHCSDHIIAVYK